MINYGIPYMGSKSKIAADLIRVLPSGKRFVDVFAGGCAMTHAAMLVGRWDRFLVNDVCDAPALFVDAVKGKYRNEDRWISREDFFRLKATDGYARFCFSFGNNGESYMYSTSIEPYKKACHYAVVFDDWGLFDSLCPEVSGAAKRALRGKTDRTQRRLALGPAVVAHLKALRKPGLIESNPLYASYKPASLQSLECLERRKGDYRTLVIEPGDVLYCDPPYKGTATYNGTGFDHEAFYSWAEAQAAKGVPVYISEYDMPSDRFLCIWRKKTRSLMSQKGTDGDVEERLFVPRPKRK